MSILSVDNISPIGSGTSVTVNNAATLVVNNLNASGVSTFSDIVDVTGSNSTVRLGSNASRRLMYRSGENDIVLEAASNFFYRQKISDTSHRWYTNGADEKLMITGAGLVGISSNTPTSPLEIHTAAGSNAWKFKINTSVSDGAGFYQRANGDFEMVLRDASNNNNFVSGNNGGLELATSGTEKLRITSSGEVGISPGSVNPSAGDLSSGDSQNTPVIHVKGNGSSATGGVYNLLARFEAGGDADGTGAMIVLNHANDRGLAIQGGRRTGNYAHGALKMIDNVGRVSDAMLIHGGAGEGVDHINFYTGVNTTTTNRLQIDSSGRVLIGTTNTSNGHIAASKAAVHGHLAIFKDSEGDLAGVNSHQIKFVTQSGSISEIQATSIGAGGPAGRGGYLSFFAKPNNNATLKETMRVAADFVTIFRENTGNEGGQIGLARSSDNTAYWFIDSYGSSSTPDFRLHCGGSSHFSINSNGQWVDAPTGSVINVGYARYDPNNDSYAVISQDTRAASAVYLDFTPRRADSKLIIMTRMHTRMIAANGCSYGIEQSTNSGGSYSDLDGMNQRNAMDFFYKGDGVNHHYTGFCMRQIDAYSGTRRFSPWGQGWDGGTWEISYGHGEHSVTIYEVAV